MSVYLEECGPDFMQPGENGLLYYSLKDGAIDVVVDTKEQAEELALPFSTDRRIAMVAGRLYFEDEIPPRVYSAADYDYVAERVMEEQRRERGYTTREPSDYAGSGNPRWRQDAADWIKYRDEVMEFSLKVQNEMELDPRTAMPIDEFERRIPRIRWTCR